MRQLNPPKKMIFFNKEDVARFTSTEVQSYRSRIGVVFQDFKLIDWMTVSDNISYPLRIHGKTLASEQQHSDHLLKLL